MTNLAISPYPPDLKHHILQQSFSLICNIPNPVHSIIYVTESPETDMQVYAAVVARKYHPEIWRGHDHFEDVIVLAKGAPADSEIEALELLADRVRDEIDFIMEQAPVEISTGNGFKD